MYKNKIVIQDKFRTLYDYNNLKIKGMLIDLKIL